MKQTHLKTNGKEKWVIKFVKKHKEFTKFYLEHTEKAIEEFH